MNLTPAAREPDQATLAERVIWYLARADLPSPFAAPIQMVNTCAALAGIGYQVNLLCQRRTVATGAELWRHYGVEPAPRLTCHGLKTNRYFPPRVFGPSPYAFVFHLEALARVARRGRTGAREARPIILVRGEWQDKAFWAWAKRRLGWLRNWRVVFESHQLDFRHLEQLSRSYSGRRGLAAGKTLAWNRREARDLAAYDAVVAITRALAEDLLALEPPPRRVAIIPDATALPLAAKPASLDFGRGKQIVLGYAGSHWQWKGTALLLEALKLLDDRYVLHLIGDAGPAAAASPDGREFWRRVVVLGLAGRVVPLGRVPYREMAGPLAGCHVFLLPTGATEKATRYTSPLKLFDYLSQGRPIVAANVPAFAEILADGGNALLYENGNAASLAEKIRALAASPELAEKLAAQALRDAAQYTYRRRAEKYDELFCSL